MNFFCKELLLNKKKFQNVPFRTSNYILPILAVSKILRCVNDTPKSTQPAFTCSKLTIETLEQRCEIRSKLRIKSPKQRQCRRFGGFVVNFEHISHLCSGDSIVNFEHVIAGWV